MDGSGRLKPGSAKKPGSETLIKLQYSGKCHYKRRYDYDFNVLGKTFHETKKSALGNLKGQGHKIFTPHFVKLFRPWIGRMKHFLVQLQFRRDMYKESH